MNIQFSDITRAREILRGQILPTPVLADEKLSREIGAESFIKAESLQKGGSFKVRGAFNKISRLTDEEKERGVIAPSVGNHAQGVALAAQLHDIRATIIMPKQAPLTKIAATKRFGADVILHGESFDEAAAYAQELKDERGYTYVHAFNDELIIAGQGTLALEILEDLEDLDLLVVPIGGGGLISGISIAAKKLRPELKIVGVQAENAPSMSRSFKAGEPVQAAFQTTIADGIAVKKPSEMTFEIIRKNVDDVVEVSEDEIARGIFHCVQHTRLVVEGAGAAGLAALLAGKIKVSADQKVCALLCGGNIDANLLTRILEQVLVRQGRYIILKLLVADRPGGLSALTEHVAQAGANIIEVFHRRSMWLAPLGRVGIEMLLEVRDEEHGQEVYRHLEEAGYHVEREGQGDWEE